MIADPLDGTTATKYEIIGPPPALGALQARDTEPLPTDEVVILGAPGSSAPLITDTESP